MKRFITVLTISLAALFLMVPPVEAKHRHKEKHRMERPYASHHRHHNHDDDHDNHRHHKRHKPKKHYRRHHHGPRVVRYYEPERVVYVSHSRPGIGFIPLINFSLGPVVNATVNVPMPVAHTHTTVVVDHDDYCDDGYYWGKIGHYENNFWPVSILSYEL